MRDSRCTNRKNSFGNGRNNDDALFSLQNGGDFQNFIRLRQGKIDFGAGRAPGVDGKSILALSEGKDTRFEDLYKKLSETLHLMNDKNGEEYLNQNVVANPTGCRTAFY